MALTDLCTHYTDKDDSSAVLSGRVGPGPLCLLSACKAPERDAEEKEMQSMRSAPSLCRRRCVDSACLCLLFFWRVRVCRLSRTLMKLVWKMKKKTKRQEKTKQKTVCRTAFSYVIYTRRRPFIHFVVTNKQRPY